MASSVGCEPGSSRTRLQWVSRCPVSGSNSPANVTAAGELVDPANVNSGVGRGSSNRGVASHEGRARSECPPAAAGGTAGACRGARSVYSWRYDDERLQRLFLHRQWTMDVHSQDMRQAQKTGEMPAWDYVLEEVQQVRL
ncbi:uncharacterized protein LOC126285234 [Schistocerca gregaria]|uniref:uncharacterized protein LOC126285234 n=1 Tax=Schistocerca gregaria TaxID=7010 RepID=UPI00211DDA2E|nr:uncharacterized protein LOC126285234 [Schistocerca gregaria]